MRKVCNRSTFLGMFGAVLLASTANAQARDTPAPAVDDVALTSAQPHGRIQQLGNTHPLHSPVAAERIEAEIAATEAAFGGQLDIVNMQQERYTTADGGLYDPDGPDADEMEPVELFYHPDRARLEADLFQAFEQAGTLKTHSGGQYQPVESYFPEGQIPEQAEQINTELARHMSQVYVNSLVSPNPANGSAMVLDFTRPDNQDTRVCVTVLTPSVTDEDMFMGGFTNMDTRGIDLELADLYQFVANHEFAHCMNTGQGMPIWFNETMADAYALTRHFQLNGDDGFAETLISMRQLNAVRNRDIDHYTVPGIERVLPQIREAYESGALDGLNPRQIRDLTVEMMMGHSEQEALASQQEILAAQGTAARILGVLPTLTTVSEGRMTFREGLPDAARTQLQPFVDQTNQAIAHLSRPNAVLAAAALNSSEAEIDYRDNLDEYVATQPDHETAQNGMRARLYGLNRLREAFIEAEGIENIEQFDNAYDGSKITLSRQMEIIREYEQELSQDRALGQDHSAERDSRNVG